MVIGGRPRQIEVDDIIAAGREIGLRDLSLNAVATRLGVSATALYRHVTNRWGLEQLIGESLLSDLHLRDDPDHDVQTQLLAFGAQFFDFVVEHPGLATYLQTLFPRGEGGRNLLAAESTALERRGYSTEAAIVLASAVAIQIIGHAATEDAQRTRRGTLSWEAQNEEAVEGLRSIDRLYQAHHRLPQLSTRRVARVMLAVTVRSVLDIFPPGRDVTEVIAELEAMTSGLDSTINAFHPRTEEL